MTQSNRDGAACLLRYGAHACTDVTGFGLLGHLVEMVRASKVDVELDLSAVPLLDGAAQMVAAGIVSSLQPQNVRLRRAIANIEQAGKDPRYPLIFDPQTAGGLLASVPANRVEACIIELRSLGYARAAVIGSIAPPSERLEPITILV
jgi:selenide,water dikinase